MYKKACVLRLSILIKHINSSISTLHIQTPPFQLSNFPTFQPATVTMSANPGNIIGGHKANLSNPSPFSLDISFVLLLTSPRHLR